MTHQEFKLLFEEHFAAIRNYVFYRSGSTELATDLAQETFIKIWEKRDNINKEKVSGLLYKIANDLFVSNYRKAQHGFKFFDSYQLNEKSLTPEDALTFEELKQSYKRALSEMPEKQRTVFLMSRMENLKYIEIADICGISAKAVEKRMKNALEFLRQNLITNEG